jgi:hypothetical protein
LENSSISEINQLEDINLIVLPILENNLLHTTKYLDYLYYQAASNSSLPTARLKGNELCKAENFKSLLNLGRPVYNMSVIPELSITSVWWLGFVEGEGTFGFKSMYPYF